MSSEAALLEEISRLSGAINRHKTTQAPPPPAYRGRGRGGRPYASSYRGRGGFTDYTPVSRPGAAGPSTQTREVVVDGVTFQSNGKTLVRKTGNASTPTTKPPSPTSTGPESSTTDASATPTASAEPAATSTTSPPLAAASIPNSKPLVRTRNGLIAADRYKQTGPKSKGNLMSRQPYSRPITGYPKRALPGRNLTLNKKKSAAKAKRFEKQCKHFTMTGMCGRGLTCPYQHDPLKLALCPLFLSEKCPYASTPDECSLSHDPTPERTPICVRFNSSGQCYKGSSCLYPHVRVGPKKGICRDFAVVGFCERGAACEGSHLRECPDFAERGVCTRMGVKGAGGCHLPHVIRAKNQQKIGVASKATVAATPTTTTTTATVASSEAAPVVKKRFIPPGMVLGEFSTESNGDDQTGTSPTNAASSTAETTLPSADEFISLTFEESDEEDEDEDEEDEEEDAEEDEEEDEDEDADAEEVDKEMQIADDGGDAW